MLFAERSIIFYSHAISCKLTLNLWRCMNQCTACGSHVAEDKTHNCPRLKRVILSDDSIIIRLRRFSGLKALINVMARVAVEGRY